jgi:hypothetical protein
MSTFVLQRYLCYEFWAMCYEVFFMCYNRNPINNYHMGKQRQKTYQKRSKHREFEFKKSTNFRIIVEEK